MFNLNLNLLPAPHIIQMTGNSTGDDFVTTDPHGNLDVLQKVATACFEGDGKGDNRLFLCGDLVDRGPDSLAIIRYIQLQNVGSKKIYAIRGNHEDLVLRALHFIEIFTLLRARQADDSDFIIDKASDLRLNALAPNWRLIISDKGLKLQERVLNFSYEMSTKKEHYAVVHFSELENALANCININGGEHYKIIKKLFTDTINAIANGAGWVFRLTPAELAEVKDFIMSLPYIIRVKAVMQDDQVITAAFDIVHAAPLREERMAAILAESQCLTAKEIEYVTWARPRSLCRKGLDVEMDLSYRAVDSVLAYVGHNVLSAHRSDYRDKNIRNLDADTYGSNGMFIVNHSKAILSVEPPSLRIMGCEMQVALWTLRDMLHPERVAVGQKHNDMYLYALLASSSEKFYVDAVLKNQSHTLPGDVSTDPGRYRDFKEAFSEAVKFMPIISSPQFCIDLSYFLLNQPQHPLAREFSVFEKNRYSHQTKSMSTATGLLLQQGALDSNSDSKVVVKKQCFSTKVVFFVPSQGEGKGQSSQKVYSFSGYRKVF